MSEPRPRTLSEPRPMTRSYSKVASSNRSIDSESNKSASSVSRLKPLRPQTRLKATPTPAKITVPPPPTSIFQSMLSPVIQSPPVFIGASTSLNQTFHTSAEPSPESSEPLASLNPTPPWDAHRPQTPPTSSHWSHAFSDVQKPEQTPLLLGYSHPVQTPSQNVNEAWPQETHVRMIEPCFDYTQHTAWLQHNFPEVKTATRNYLVQLVHKIKSFEHVGTYMSMPPNEWQAKLGGYLYEMYIDTIIQLVCIWHFTVCLEEPTPYDLYLEHELEYKHSIEEVFKTLLKTGGGYIGYNRAPPKYTKESPEVKKSKDPPKAHHSPSTTAFYTPILVVSQMWSQTQMVHLLFRIDTKRLLQHL